MEVHMLTRKELREMIDEVAAEAARRTRHEMIAALSVSPPAWLYKEWVTTQEACWLLGAKDRRAVRRLQGVVESRRVGRELLWRRTSLLDYIDGSMPIDEAAP